MTKIIWVRAKASAGENRAVVAGQSNRFVKFVTLHRLSFLLICSLERYGGTHTGLGEVRPATCHFCTRHWQLGNPAYWSTLNVTITRRQLSQATSYDRAGAVEAICHLFSFSP